MGVQEEMKELRYRIYELNKNIGELMYYFRETFEGNSKMLAGIEKIDKVVEDLESEAGDVQSTVNKQVEQDEPKGIDAPGRLEPLYPEIHAYNALNVWDDPNEVAVFAHNALEQSIMKKARKLGYTGTFDKLMEMPVVRLRRTYTCDNCECEQETDFVSYQLDTLVEGKLTPVH